MSGLDEFKELADKLLWRPIESVPKDGNDVLIAMWHPDWTMIVACYDETNPEYPWLTLDGPSYHKDAPEFWMPLPDPPPSLRG